eukprot:TRINITY_DN11448_c0_g1_i10.p2 TRINITY_DN11448_c0_g1~~TRINITY_DN11448_c0_g1_i10.p2  ORF type:complete len:232 (-),score=85.63 TRINITY_DN11448_c0_g1_i10:109-804(-)
MVVNDIARTIKLRLKSSAPRRPPRVLLMGAPGSGKTTLGNLIAKKFGLVYIDALNLLHGEIASKTDTGEATEELLKEGEPVPDDTMLKLVQSRLNKTDSQTNGWVLEGFPKTEGQMNMLKELKQTPSLIVVLQIDDDIVYERHEYKKSDPVTGKVYNLKGLSELLEEEVLARLVSREEDRYEMVKGKLKAWKELLPKLEEEFKERRLLLNADKTVQVLAESISEAIENPIC